MHIPDGVTHLYFEKFYFASGRFGIQEFQAEVLSGRIRDSGVLGPVVSGRRASDRDAGRLALLFYPTAIGWHT